MFETKPRESMNRSLGALLIAFSLFLSGCTSETEKPLDPLLDEDGDGLSNGWELDRGFDPRNASDVLICQGQAKFCERKYDNHTFPETHNSFSITRSHPQSLNYLDTTPYESCVDLSIV